MYEMGRGVSKDEKAAGFWYTQAAVKGHVVAQFQLALMLAEGRGVKKDLK